MGAVAERLEPGLAASAERERITVAADRRPVGGDQLHRPTHEQRPVPIEVMVTERSTAVNLPANDRAYA
jgi:hypothetical protein